MRDEREREREKRGAMSVVQQPKDKSCANRFCSSLRTAPPGPFPTLALLGLLGAIAGAVLSGLGAADAAQKVGQVPLILLGILVAIIVISIITPVFVFLYGIYARRLYVSTKYSPAVVGATTQAQQSNSCCKGVLHGVAAFLLQLLTVAAVIIAVAMLLVSGTGVLVAIGGEEGCAAFEIAANGYPADVSNSLDSLNGSFAEPLVAATALCGTINRIEDQGAAGLCYTLEVAVTSAHFLLSLWPLEIDMLEGYGPSLGVACLNFTSSFESANTAICEPLFDGNQTRISEFLDSVGSTLTAGEYSESVLEANIEGDGTPLENLKARILILSAVMRRADGIIFSVVDVARVSCEAATGLRGSVLLCVVGAAVLLVSAALIRTVLVRYHRFITFWLNRGAGAIPLDSVVALVLVVAGGIVCVVGVRQAINELDGYNRNFELENSDAVQIIIDLLPVVAAFVIAVVLLWAIALLVLFYGIATRRLIYHHDGCGEQCLRRLLCEDREESTRRWGRCCAFLYKALLGFMLFVVNLLSLILLILVSVALALAFGGRYAGGLTAASSTELDTVLRPPPVIQVYNDIKNGDANYTKQEVCSELNHITNAIATSDVDVMKVCKISSFAIGLITTLLNQPPINAGLDESDYVFDCDGLAMMFEQGRARCDNTTAVAAGVTLSEVDEAAGEVSLLGFVSDFIRVYGDIVEVNLRVRLIALRVEGSTNVLIDPFVVLIIGAIVVVVGAYLTYFSFSRYYMLERVHKLKKKALQKVRTTPIDTPVLARA